MTTATISSTPIEFEAFLVKIATESHGKVPVTMHQWFARSVKGWSVNKSGNVCAVYIGNKQYSLKKAIALAEKEFAEHVGKA